MEWPSPGFGTVREGSYADTDKAKAEAVGNAALNNAKQRNGPTGDVPLIFIEDRAEGAEPRDWVELRVRCFRDFRVSCRH